MSLVVEVYIFLCSYFRIEVYNFHQQKPYLIILSANRQKCKRSMKQEQLSMIGT
jgi:hypothetical protein